MKETSGQSVHPLPTVLPETVARETFQSLLAALSNPGRIFTLPGSPRSNQHSCQQIGFTLLDLESSFYTPDPALAAALQQSGAHSLGAAEAAYLFFPDQRVPELLASVEQAKIGVITDPDEGATMIVACTLGKGQLIACTGPGIPETQALRVDGLAPQFWQLRAAKIRYPLGVDLFLVDQQQIVGLPRSTVLTVE